jgi:hypothetical protein
MINNSSNDAEATLPQRRRIVVFFLVKLNKRIVSTREVASQREGAMSREDALRHRLELMQERKYHNQDWNVRRIELVNINTKRYT